MALDIILGRTQRNWARGLATTKTSGTPLSDEVTLRLTEAEMKMLADLASARARAEGGDKKAKKIVARTAADVPILEKRAARGDERAARTLRVLRESGVFNPTQTFALGAEGLVPNASYRAAVLRQARRLAGKARPTTRHFFKAKSAVDGTMRKNGLAIYLPGSAPGRMTY